MGNLIYSTNLSIGRDRVGLENSKPEIANLIASSKVSDEIHWELAEVIDVILDKNHKDYPKKEDDESFIGRAKVRRMHSDNNKEIAELPYAKPIAANVRIYPLIGELVLTGNFLSGLDAHRKELYYLNTINIYGKPNNNSFKNLTKPVKKNVNSNSYESSKNNVNQNKEKNDDKIGNHLKNENDKHVPLRAYEGDVLIEGRHGQSLRFSVGRGKGDFFPDFPEQPSTYAILSIKKEKDSKKERYLREEDVNSDDACLLLSSEMNVKLTLGSSLRSSFGDSFPEKFDGKQIIAASDRIILNARNNECLFFGKKCVGLSTEGSIFADAGKNVVIDATKIMLGNSADEPVIMGNKWKSFMEKFIDTLLTTQFYFGCLNPAPLQNLKKELNSLLSKQTFIKEKK